MGDWSPPEGAARECACAFPAGNARAWEDGVTVAELK